MKRYRTGCPPTDKLQTSYRSVLRDSDYLANKRKVKPLTDGALERSVSFKEQLRASAEKQKKRSLERVERMREGHKVVYVR